MMQTNIGDIRANIMRLESEQVFKGSAWMDVIEKLRVLNRPAAIADVERRMETARQNCNCEICQIVRLKRAGKEGIEVVAVETEVMA